MLATWDAVSTLDRLFHDLMGSALDRATSTRTFDPAIDVRASEHEVTFVCDVPGVKEGDIEVTLDNHVLTIQGRRTYERKSNERMLVGRGYGAFRRSFTLPDGLDQEKLEASLEDGVLTLRIPKLPTAKPRKISIVSGGAKQLEE